MTNPARRVAGAYLAPRRGIRTGMKSGMDAWGLRWRQDGAAVPRAQLDAAVRLATTVSLAAAPTAAVAAAVGAATSVLVLLVMVVGFTLSAAQTSRIARLQRVAAGGRRHRVTLVAQAPRVG